MRHAEWLQSFSIVALAPRDLTRDGAEHSDEARGFNS
jgi:hypothetical protein